MDSIQSKSNLGLWMAVGFGATGFITMAIATPFVLPALRRHCLPYVPATDTQLSNLTRAFKKHASKGGDFLDVGSGDGRICRLAARQKIFNQIHGVELNSVLVCYSRLKALLSRDPVMFHRADLWKFNLSKYDYICIFGVESMMDPLEKYMIKGANHKTQTIFACRFAFRNLPLIDEIGSGIDTVWVYRLYNQKLSLNNV